MKKVILITLVFILSAGFYTSYIINRSMTEILKQINLSEESAKDYIWSDISYSNFNFPSAGELKNIAKGERAGIVQTVAQYVKDYSKTEAFKQKYMEFREMKKPAPPEKPKTMADSRNEQKEQMKKSIEEMKKNMKNIPADQKQMFEGIIKSSEEQLASLDNPEASANDAQYNQYMQQGYESQMEEYKNKVAAWESEYPENNPKPLIKKWLNDFLAESANVDFGAELRDNKYGKKVFVKSEYEEKSSIWKLCYRTGKEPVEAARSFAQAWLNELK